MTKHLKDMSLDELKAGHEKGKVTDEEIEHHLLGQIHSAIKREVVGIYGRRNSIPKHHVILDIDCIQDNYYVSKAIEKLAEHEYQKLKDND